MTGETRKERILRQGVKTRNHLSCARRHRRVAESRGLRAREVSVDQKGTIDTNPGQATHHAQGIRFATFEVDPGSKATTSKRESYERTG